MKKRKGFGKINIDGEKFLFNWADNPNGPLLVMYDQNDRKIEIDFEIWRQYPDSDEYHSGLPSITIFNETFYIKTWHGKHKRGPEWGGWGKREAREIYRKWRKHNQQK